MRERGRVALRTGLAAVAGWIALLGSVGFATGGLPGASAGSGRMPDAFRTPPRPDLSRVQEFRDALPVRFEPNRGQADPAARFLARCRGFTCFLTESEAAFTLGGADGPDPGRFPRGNGPVPRRSLPEGTVRMRFEGAAPARFEGRELLPGRSHYLKGSEPEGWRTGIPGFGRVEARDVWPGVDLVFRGDPSLLEYDLVLAPGADPSSVILRFEGVEGIRREEDGALLLATGLGEMRHSAPILWQAGEGVRRSVEGGFAILGDGRVGLEVGAYDRGLPLVVDPKVEYASYHGGGGQDVGYEVVADSSGNIFVAGFTNSTDFPLANAYQSSYAGGSGSFPDDAFVTKFTSSGSLVFSTYLGGSGFDDCYGLAVDSGGSAHVCGITNSTNFPTVSAYQSSYPGGYSSIYVAKLSSGGSSLAFSTYLGGSGTDDSNGIAVDSDGSVLVTGTTASTSFPLLNPLQSSKAGGNTEGYVTRLSSTGASLVWSTYLGGSKTDVPWDVALDGSGNVFVAGFTDSTDFPTANPVQGTYAGGSGNFPDDAFLTKINAAGTAIVFSTYYGGAGFDDCRAVSVDGNGAAAIVGFTSSSNFPVANAVQSGFGGGAHDAYAVKFSVQGTSVSYATYLGGLSTDAATDGAQDASGRLTVGGYTSSNNFPLKNPVQSTYIGGGSPYPNDGLLFRMGTSGELLFSTYLGGSGFDDAYSVATDSAGRAYLVGITSSTDYPTRNPGQATLKGGGYDGYLTRLGLVVPSPPTALGATAIGSAAVFLGWTDNSTDETGFDLQRKTPVSAWIDLAHIPSGTTLYEDYAVGASTAYTYRVRASGPDGPSEWSNEATATTGAIVPVPAAPSGLSATVLSPVSVRLDWSDNSDNEVTFEVARRLPPGAFATVASLPAGSTAWTDASVLPARDYLYRVRAVGTAGPSPYAPEAGATTSSTIEITLLKGALTDSAKFGRDSVRIAGAFVPPEGAADGILDPVADGITFLVGSADSPVTVSAPPEDEGWKVRGSKVSWKSPKGSSTKAKLSLDLEKGTFKVSAKALSLAAPPANPLRVALHSGIEGGRQESAWTVKKEGVLRFP